MKTYRNSNLGFEMIIPEAWSVEEADQLKRETGNLRTLIFRCRKNETFKLCLRKLDKEPELKDTETEFRRAAMDNWYSSLGMGKLRVNGKETIWGRYYEGYGHWTKKYIIAEQLMEYAFTAGCLEQKSLLEMEKDWDEAVSSFRPLLLEPERLVSKSAASETIKNDYSSIGRELYTNEKHQFCIQLPANWSLAPEPPSAFVAAFGLSIPPGMNKDCFQFGCMEEAMNFEIAPLSPEPLLEDTEKEFVIFTRMRGYKNLHFGRINVAGKEHVCADYFIDDAMGKRWNKKYMLVFGGIEYALTCTTHGAEWFAAREKDWDVVVRTFRPLKKVDQPIDNGLEVEKAREERRAYVQQHAEMLEDPWKLYAKACEAMALRQYVDAQILLNEYLQLAPDHIQAHKDLARILEKTGDIDGAVQHLKEVQRLDPDDKVNRSNLARLGA